MSRQCQISKRGPLHSKQRSHAMNANPKKWAVNLQVVRIMVNGSPKKIKASARAIRTMKHKGQIVL